MEITHVGIYHRFGGREPIQKYCFYLGNSTDFPEWKQRASEHLTDENFERVKVIKLPVQTAREIKRLNKTSMFYDPEDENELGWIIYNINNTRAVSGSLYPKNRYDFEILVDKRVLPGLGALLEHACAEHLRSIGITHYSSTHLPDDTRKGQLKKLGLPIDTPVPIDEWIAKLEKGFPKQPEGRLARVVKALRKIVR